METEHTKLAVIAIVVEQESSVRQLNELLHGCSSYIIGRMGIPCRQRGVSLISVAMDAPADVISSLSGKLGRISGVSAKVAYSKLPEH
ncbi:MAG: iron-only hydrogenase system regulator [Eubacterium sp.]|jgi:putative iron-only hydrogenase system regulator|nr:iron-only hydrogenase system regulator [Eubacterium sp.]